MTEAQKKASSKYQKEKTKVYTFKLTYSSDSDLIELLDSQENKQGFIKQCLKKEVKRVI